MEDYVSIRIEIVTKINIFFNMTLNQPQRDPVRLTDLQPLYHEHCISKRTVSGWKATHSCWKIFGIFLLSKIQLSNGPILECRYLLQMIWQPTIAFHRRDKLSSSNREDYHDILVYRFLMFNKATNSPFVIQILDI